MKPSKLISLTVCALLAAQGIRNLGSAEHATWDVISSGGTTESSGGGFRMSASVGQVGVDMLTGTTHRVYSGFWNPWLFSPVGVESHYGFGVPTAYQLSQNYPNPFCSKTTVPFALPEPSRVSVEIYNLQGQMVRQIAQETKEPGYYVVAWDGKDDSGRRAGDGVYVCRMIARPQDGQPIVLSRSMVLVQ